MSVLSIVKLYEPNLFCKGTCLRYEAENITKEELNEKWLELLIKDMLETLYTQPAGIGLAANQVGVLKKVSVIDLKRDAKQPIVLINPVYTPINYEKVKRMESCLSFPGLSVPVMRYSKIHLKYMDINGNENELDVEGFKSYVFQHEIDHLYGKPHIDVSDTVEDMEYYLGKEVLLAENAYSLLKK